KPPRIVKQPAFTLESTVKRCAGKRREMIKRRDVHRVLLGKPDGLGKALRRVAIVTENEGAVDADAMPPQVGKRLLESAAHRVERFVHLPEVFRIETLKPDEHAHASALHEQVEKLLVMRRDDARLTHPSDLRR